MTDFVNTRSTDVFFEDAINRVFLDPNHTFYHMDGPIAMGKTSNFVMQGGYTIAQCVQPVKFGGKLVRHSKWLAARENEVATVATFLHLIETTIFSPSIMSMKNSPVTTRGSHPTTIRINHALSDGTELLMDIECHGFNTEKAYNRIKSQEFFGALVPESQSIPELIYHTIGERCGRWYTDDLSVIKMIDGKAHKLSGLGKLKLVLSDSNVPARHHYHYKMYYDVQDKSKLPYLFITPPEPLLRIPVDECSPEILKKYPSTVFEGKKVCWLPNPKIYNMTRHFEERDDMGNRIPWSGYTPWYKELYRSNSEVRRNVLGKPDKEGGISTVYAGFKSVVGKTLVEKTHVVSEPLYIGFDPGSYASSGVSQERNGWLHTHDTFDFDPVDNASTRNIFEGFVFPHCRKKYVGCHIIIVADPASSGLGKNLMAGATESVRDMIVDEMRKEMARPDCKTKYTYEDCLVQNQNTDARINCLKYFIDQDKYSSDPSNERLNRGLAGAYRYKTTKSGMVSHMVDKESADGLLHSHSVEALQYVAVNIRAKLELKWRKHTTQGRSQISQVARKK